MSVMMKSDEELMQEFEAKQKAAKEANKTFDNFFFFLKEDGEKAIVHPLLNIPQVTQTELLYHEKFDHVSGKMVADNVCATPFGEQCKLCKEAESDKKLKATPRVFLPVYVQGIWKQDLFGKLVAVTFKDDLGVEAPIKGVRMLKLKLGAAILDALKGEYYEDQYRNIQAFDFTIARSGAGLDTKYTVSRRHNVLPIEGQIPVYNADRVVSDVRLHREVQSIETPEGEQTIESPQMTVEEALDMQKPSENQLKRIRGLCQLLDKPYIEPVSWGQAQNMQRNLQEEVNATLSEV